MKWNVAATVLTDKSDPGLLGKHLDRVMEELEKLDAEPDITATLAKGLVEIEVVVTAKTMREAWEQGLSTIRCGLHASGASTPDWPTPDDFDEPEQHPDGTWVAKIRGAEARDRQLVSA